MWLRLLPCLLPFPSLLFPASLMSKTLSPERFLGCLVFFRQRPDIPFTPNYYLRLDFKRTGRRAHKAIRSALYRRKRVRATHLLLHIALSLHCCISLHISHLSLPHSRFPLHQSPPAAPSGQGEPSLSARSPSA